jgi:hypothetical protein
MTVDNIYNYVRSLDHERAEIEKQLHELAWYMRGSYDYDTLLNMDSTQRSYMLAHIQKRIQTVEDTKLPLL